MAKTWRSPLVEDMLKRCAAADAARPEGLPLAIRLAGSRERLPAFRRAGAGEILELRLQRLTGLGAGQDL